jgi:hypothetical protein
VLSGLPFSQRHLGLRFRKDNTVAAFRSTAYRCALAVPCEKIWLIEPINLLKSKCQKIPTTLEGYMFSDWRYNQKFLNLFWTYRGKYPTFLLGYLLSPRSVAMSKAHFSLEDLFAQLGLNNDPASIDTFISQHHPLPNEIALYRASIWTPAQRAFLKEEIIGDGDWALAIDELNRRLH